QWVSQLTQSDKTSWLPGFSQKNPQAVNMTPFLCMENLDFKQNIATKSLGDSKKIYTLLGDISITQSPISQVGRIQIPPQIFIPSPKEEDNWKKGLNLQIELPEIKMLKLMLASDNSAQGVGKVFESIIAQSSLTETDEMKDFIFEK
ncbi:hypothetical protein VP01_8006g1, partial [Puccinia sorghi]